MNTYKKWCEIQEDKAHWKAQEKRKKAQNDNQLKQKNDNRPTRKR